MAASVTTAVGGSRGPAVGPVASAAAADGQTDVSGLPSTPEIRGGYRQIRDRDEKTQAILADLESAVDQIAGSGQVEAWLDAMATDGLQRWSANNRILALVQLQDLAHRTGRPELLDEIHMMTAKQWKDRHGRWPAKGSSAVYILRPRTRKIVEEDDDGTTDERVIVTGFAAVPVFNVTQTDGQPLPAHPSRPVSGDVAPRTIDGLRGQVAAAGYAYSEEEIPGTNPTTGAGMLGYTTKDGRVVVDARLSPAQKASTIAHELGHIHAGHLKASYAEYQQHRGQMETEAEASGYLTCRRLGMAKGRVEAFSPGYIAGWMAQKGARFQDALDVAVKASDKTLNGWPDTSTPTEVKAS